MVAGEGRVVVGSRWYAYVGAGLVIGVKIGTGEGEGTKREDDWKAAESRGGEDQYEVDVEGMLRWNECAAAESVGGAGQGSAWASWRGGSGRGVGQAMHSSGSTEGEAAGEVAAVEGDDKRV